MTPRASVVLLARDGAGTLPAVLAALAEQEVPFPFETVAVDSGSTDGTRELLGSRVDRLLEVPPEDFDHGLTRNRGIAAAQGDLVVLLVQDAVPASTGWLAALTAPFAADPRLAGAFARQLPRPGASRLGRHALKQWVAAGERGYIREVSDPPAYRGLQPMERFLTSVFDNVCSCLRREVWEHHPFRPTDIAEDVAWGEEVLLAGYRIAYVPEAAVLHSHERSVRHELARTFLSHRRLYELFGLRTVPSVPSLVRSLATTVADHLRVLVRGEGPAPGPAEVARVLGLAVAWPLGQYLGGRAGARRCHRLPPERR